MNGRGQYGDRFRYGYASPRMMIGLSPESLKEDLERLNDEVQSLQEKITVQMAETAMQVAPGQSRHSPLNVFYQKRWSPFVARWRRYYDDLKGASDASWSASTKIIESALSDWQSKLIDVRADHAGLRTNGAGPSAPASAPRAADQAPFSGPSAPASAPRAADQSSNVGLYVALGLGAVAVAATVMAFRHTEAA